MEKWKRYLLILSIIIFLGTFCFAGLRPLISLYAYYEHSCDYTQIGMIGAVTGFFFSFSSFPFGRLSDWKGRKGVILIGSTGLALTPLFIFFSTNFLQIFIFSAALGIFVGAWFPITGAIAADVSFPKKGNIMSIYSVTISTAYTIAYFLSFFLLDFFVSNFFIVFLFLSLAAAVATFFIVVYIKGKRKERNENNIISHNNNSLVMNFSFNKEEKGEFTPAAFIYGFFVGTIFVLFPVYARSMEISYTKIGIILFSFSLIRTITYVGMVKIMEIMKNELLMNIGLLGCSLSALLIYVFKSFYCFLGAFSLLGFTIGIVYLSAISIAAGSKLKGKAMGAYEAALGTGAFTGPLICGYFAEKAPSNPYLVCAIVAVSAVFVCNIYLHKHKHNLYSF